MVHNRKQEEPRAPKTQLAAAQQHFVPVLMSLARLQLGCAEILQQTKKSPNPSTRAVSASYVHVKVLSILAFREVLDPQYTPH